MNVSLFSKQGGPEKNGELLDLAEPLFDVLVTLDTNVQYQQNLAGRKIAVVVLHSSSNRLELPSPILSGMRVGHSKNQAWPSLPSGQ